MKRLAWILGATVLMGSSVASAASLGGLTDGTVAAEQVPVVACDGDGVNVGYVTSGGNVTSVTIAGIADPGCEGAPIEARVVDGTGVSIASGSSTVPTDGDTSDNSVTVAVSPSVDADTVQGARVKIGSGGSATMCTLTAISDTYVTEGSFIAHGGETYLHVTSYYPDRRAFLKFDVASCSIPASANVVSALVTLQMYDAPDENRTFEVTRATSAFDEATTDWYDQPSVSSTATTTFATGTTNDVQRHLSVLPDVEAFVDGSSTNHGWRIVDPVTGGDAAYFRSREHGTAAERPKLIVEYYP